MMLSFLRSLATIAVLCSPLLAGEGWVADYDEAVKIAKAEKKDLFVDFTGSDWCGWCKKLDKEVFVHDAFKNEITKNFVLVSLDFPRSEEAKAKVPNPNRNKELQELHGVQGFPTILLITAEGEVFGQTGYQQGGPEKYMEHIKELTTSGKKDLAESKVLVAAWEKAKDKDKWAAWDKIAAALETASAESILAKAYLPAVRSALESDKDNKLGKKLRAIEVLMKSGNANEEVITAALALDPKNEKGLKERAVRARFDTLQSLDDVKAAVAAAEELLAGGKLKDSKIDFDINFICAFMNKQHLKNDEAAKKFATRAKEIGGGDPRQMEFLDSILAG